MIQGGDKLNLILLIKVIMIKNNYIMKPDYYLKGDFKISPFNTNDIRANKLILEKSNGSRIEQEKFDKYFKSLLTEAEDYIITQNARSAIKKILDILKLRDDDEVAILTTTGNKYISSCVTREIEKFCLWSREITDKTKAIFVNHEFGVCYENLEKLKEYGLPIIEDCAHSFFSNNSLKTKGIIGDFVIYSLPKYFPIQIGGVLKYKKKYFVKSDLDLESEKYIKNIVGYYIKNIEKWAKKRVKNYLFLEKKLGKIGIESRFKIKEGFIPGVYMFRNSKKINLNSLKEYLWNLGIECSVFYGEDSFFIPINHRLKKEELEYFVEAIKCFEGVKE